MSQKNPSERTSAGRIAVWIFCFAICVRLVLLSRLWRSPFNLTDQSDMRLYNDWALRILAGEWTDHRAFIAMPGYSFFLAAIYRVTGPQPWFIGVLNVISESLIAVVLFFSARLVFGKDERDRRGEWIGIIAAIAWIFYRPAQVYSLVLMPMTFVVLAFWLVVSWCVGAEVERENARTIPQWQFLLAGFGIGIAATFVATILFAIPLAVAAALRQFSPANSLAQRTVRCAAGIVCALAGVGAGTSPVWIHNYFIAKDPVFLSAHGGLNFWIGNNPTSNGYPQVPPGLKATERGMLADSFTLPPRWLHRPMTRAEISRFWSDRARAFIREQPRAWLKIMAMKFGKFWSGNEYDDLGILTNYREHGVIFGFLTFGIIATLGVPAAFFAVRESKRALWIVAAVLLHMAALMSVFVTERYRLAAAPGLILLSAFAVFWCWEKIAARRWKPLAAYIALALPVACWAMMPQSGTGIAELDDYNRGLLAMGLNDLGRAEPLLMKAYAKFPQNPDVSAALGLLALKRGNHAVAKKFLRFAVEHDAQNGGAWQNLAVIAIMENRTDVAENLLERAVAASPDDAGAFMFLAKTRKQNGDIAGALVAVESALRLDPARTEAIQLKAELSRRQSATPPK